MEGVKRRCEVEWEGWRLRGGGGTRNGGGKEAKISESSGGGTGDLYQNKDRKFMKERGQGGGGLSEREEWQGMVRGIGEVGRKGGTWIRRKMEELKV